MNDIKTLHLNFINQMKAKKQELNCELSRCDLALTDALHYLELEKCDAVTMVRTAKLIKELRQDRRGIKDRMEQIDRLMMKVGNPNVLICSKKIYTYRTQVMNDVNKRNRRN